MACYNNIWASLNHLYIQRVGCIFSVNICEICMVDSGKYEGASERDEGSMFRIKIVDFLNHGDNFLV